MKFFYLIFRTIVVLIAPAASAQTSFYIDFDTDDQSNALVAGSVDLATNEPYRDLFAPGVGVRLATNNPVGKPLNIYNSEQVGGADDDLERDSKDTDEWAGGSDLDLVVDNVLIINTNSDLSTPNDSAGGGQMKLDFDVSLIEFGFDFIDLDTSDNGSITFLNTASGVSTTVDFEDFEDGASVPFGRSGVSFGDRHANRVLNVTAADLGLTSFDEVSFNLLSSGGIGTIYGTTEITTVPDPSVPSILLGGLAMLGLCRRR